MINLMLYENVSSKDLFDWLKIKDILQFDNSLLLHNFNFSMSCLTFSKIWSMKVTQRKLMIEA